MKIKDLVSEIVKREGGKSNVKIGDVREIIGILSDIVFSDAEEMEISSGAYSSNFGEALYVNGKRRAKKKKK